MTGMEFIPELIGKIDPAIVENAMKGLALSIGKVASLSDTFPAPWGVIFRKR